MAENKSIVDLSKFTFTAEQIRDINELVFDGVLHAPDLNYIHTLHPGTRIGSSANGKRGGAGPSREERLNAIREKLKSNK